MKHLSYQQVCDKTGMCIHTFSNKMNGYSALNTDAVADLCAALHISDDEIMKFFLPNMLRNASTKKENKNGR